MKPPALLAEIAAGPERHGFDEDDLPAPRHWRRTERRTLEAHWPTGGIRAVRALLPGRSDTAIRRYAERLGLKRGRAWTGGAA